MNCHDSIKIFEAQTCMYKHADAIKNVKMMRSAGKSSCSWGWTIWYGAKWLVYSVYIRIAASYMYLSAGCLASVDVDDGHLDQYVVAYHRCDYRDK